MRLYRSRHKGEPCLVVACGPSAKVGTLAGMLDAVRSITVNDAVHNGGYLVLADDRAKFLIDSYRGRIIDRKVADAEAVFFAKTAGLGHWFGMAKRPHYLPMQPMGEVNLDFPHEQIPRAHSSTSLAAGLAVYMGFTKVGIIGHDLTGHRILGRPAIVEEENRYFVTLAAEAQRMYGVEMRNLATEPTAFTALRPGSPHWLTT